MIVWSGKHPGHICGIQCLDVGIVVDIHVIIICKELVIQSGAEHK